MSETERTPEDIAAENFVSPDEQEEADRNAEAEEEELTEPDEVDPEDAPDGGIGDDPDDAPAEEVEHPERGEVQPAPEE